ncbi:ATP-binding protein [Chitinibacter sp. ZOR0017]|uniref:ATP-binding protein n=1 Tax=Chitinibacter sp. ZOR0017 TaxID=1339254 RepID=UPI00064861F2|nr:ATP-binding protein [Chitinibacter sp. ZOR0017]
MSRRFPVILLAISLVLMVNFSLIIHFEQKQKAELVDFDQQGVGNQLWQIFQTRAELQRLRESIRLRDADDFALRFDIVYGRVHSLEYDVILRQFTDPVLSQQDFPAVKRFVLDADRILQQGPLGPAQWQQLNQLMEELQAPIEDMAQRVRSEDIKRNELKQKRLANLGTWRTGLALLQVVLLLAFAGLALTALWRSEKQRLSLLDLNNSLDEARANAVAANETKSRFLAHISHEIRTPLTSILGYTERLRQNSQLTEQQRLQLSHVAHSGQHLLSLLNHVLDLSKSESGKLELIIEPLALSQLRQELVGMFALMAQEKGLRFTLDFAADLPPVLLLDGGKLRQILINLIGNSMKFTERGEVILQVRGWAEKSAYVLQLSVRDTGCGIAEHELQHLFHPFEQTESGKQLGGTGLGLALSRDYARLMGGDISAASTLGQGSEFVLTLQAQLAPATVPVSAAPAPLRPLAQGRRVMVVEDQKVNRELLCEILEEAGAQTLPMANGLEALDALSRGEVVDLVLMDYQMPGPDGLEVTSRMAALGYRQPVYLISASPEHELRQHPAFALLAGFLSKPYQGQEILDLLGLSAPVLLPASPQVDSALLTQAAAEQRLGFSRERYLGLAEKGFARLQDLEQDFVRALQGGEIDAAQRHAHSAKGIAAQLGAEQLAQQWALLEHNPQLQAPTLAELAQLRNRTWAELSRE